MTRLPREVAAQTRRSQRRRDRGRSRRRRAGSRIDRMMAAAERRRNSALFNVEYHRERFGRQLRRALDEVTESARDPASATAGQA
jgi:hypothetical protein